MERLRRIKDQELKIKNQRSKKMERFRKEKNKFEKLKMIRNQRTDEISRCQERF